jgi:hypothetical protein
MTDAHGQVVKREDHGYVPRTRQETTYRMILKPCSAFCRLNPVLAVLRDSRDG